MRGIFTMRYVLCLRWYAAVSILRYSPSERVNFIRSSEEQK